jgi:hypothetical protein
MFLRFGAAWLLGFSAMLLAQTPDTASIRGLVIDQNKGSVAGAQIKATNSLTKAERTAQSSDSGAFSLEGLPIAGTWTVAASKSGFADAQVADLTLEGGTGANITLQLNVTGGQTHVTVTGVVGEIRTDEPQLGDYLSAQTIEETPLPNRRLTFLPMLNAANRPAINQGDVFMNENLFTSNGAGRRQAWFEVDGSTNNDSWGRQTVFSNIPIDAIQEMTILENAFSAEYGGSTGSAVNIVTRTGTEKFHASVLELWRPAKTTAALSGFNEANAASGNDVATDSLGQTAASASGPIGGSGNTHYFLSGEDSRENRASPVISPVAPGNFVGHYRGWLGFLRLDHKLSDRNNIFFRSDLDGFHDTNPNGIVGGNTLPTVARVFRRRTYSEELGETFVISPTLVNSLRLQFQLASPITEFDPVVYGTQYVVPISSGGTFTTGTSQSALLMNRQYQIADTLSMVKGKHNIRYGGDMIYAHTGGNSKEFGGPIYLGQFTYNTCTQSLAYCESQAYLGNIANVKSYAQSYGNANYTVNDNLWSLFVQDDWHVRSDFTVNLGLRYEQQTFTDSRKDFAPRVGFAWNVGGDGKTVVLGGQLRADWSYRRLQLHGDAGSGRVPHHGGLGPAARISGRSRGPAAQHLPAARRPYLCFAGPDRLSDSVAEPLFRAMVARRGTPHQTGLDSERRLRRHAYTEDQPAARCGCARAVHPHAAGPDAHRSGRQLHAALLDSLVRAAQHGLQYGHGYESAAALFRDPDRREQRLPFL